MSSSSPSEAARAAHLRAIMAAQEKLERVDAAAAKDRPKPFLRSFRWRIAFATVGAALAVPLASVGLATAGVALPAPLASAFEQVGVDLPNQADDVQEILESTSPAERDCSFGREVALAASDGRAKGKATCERSRPDAAPDGPGRGSRERPQTGQWTAAHQRANTPSASGAARAPTPSATASDRASEENSAPPLPPQPSVADRADDEPAQRERSGGASGDRPADDPHYGVRPAPVPEEPSGGRPRSREEAQTLRPESRSKPPTATPPQQG